ncbi:MAG: hypothetical protein MJK14_29185 [Rivularia sp. ALOHA_DT_140]|nr:hypothetical protein [Rivularia sp. ALOHA_DT_140]
MDEVLEKLRRNWVEQLGGLTETHLLIDTKPIPVIGLKRDKRHSDFAGNASPGWCAVRKVCRKKILPASFTSNALLWL